MLLDWAAARDPTQAGLTDSHELIWTAGILLRIRWPCPLIRGISPLWKGRLARAERRPGRAKLEQ
jgi:hypothetical protein